MLIEELDIPVVDPLRDLLADLVRTPPLDHVQPRPTVLDLRAGAGPHEEGVLELPFKRVLLDMVCQSGGDFPRESLVVCVCLPTCSGRKRTVVYALGISNTSEAGPADIGSVGEVVDEILCFGQFLEHRRALDPALQEGRSCHCGGHCSWLCILLPRTEHTSREERRGEESVN